jgi:predicted dehydrogenase
MALKRAHKSTRRQLLKSAGAFVATAALPNLWVAGLPSLAAAAEKSPNERPRIGLIGCGGRGLSAAKEALPFGDFVAVCDVDSNHIDKAQQELKGAAAYNDYRKLCDSPNVDFVINATPDHWHTIINIRAVQSGKDVYSEKPLTLTIDEGKHLVEAVKQSDRVFQTGSQQRSNKTFRRACELVRNGRIGKVERVKVWLPHGLRGGPFATNNVPAGLDWDFWQGQTPAIDYVPERCHFSFRYWWDYSGGTMADWGAHHNDIALWGIGKERSGPVKIEGRSLSEPIQGGYTAASEYVVKYIYDNGIEHICKSTAANGSAGAVIGKPEPGEKYHGVQFEGTDGWIYVTRGDKIEASDAALLSEPLPVDAEKLYASDNHMGNFVDCIKTRKPTICDAEIGHRSASICHLGVIAIRLGRTLKWDPLAEKFVGDSEADGFVARDMRKPFTYEF